MIVWWGSSISVLQVVRCWEDGLAASLGDLLAMSASITKQVNKRMEAVAETGTNFLSAGLVFSIPVVKSLSIGFLR